jgi:hypothetical protein
MRSILLLALALSARAAEPGCEIIVDAGAHDRQGTTIQLALPAGTAAGTWRLSGDGFSSAAQIDVHRVAHATLPDMAAHQQRHFHLVPDAAPAPAVLTARELGDALRVEQAGRELCTYQGGPGELPDGVDPAFRRGGYIARLLTPSGALVTDDYPPDHKHQHGVWFAWTKTSFDGRTPDFWNMGQHLGTIEAVSRDPVWFGARWAGFHASHRYRDRGATPAVTVLDETWDVTIEAPLGDHPVLVIDLVVIQRCATDRPLVLTPYRYGGLGVRGNRAWDGKDSFIVLTSEGKTRADANETRGRWCHLGGLVDGHLAGVAVLDHPENYRSPQPMRINPTEPFFCYAPSQLGAWSIVPATPLVLRYRLVVGDGAADASDLNRRWNDWAEPPTVSVVH